MVSKFSCCLTAKVALKNIPARVLISCLIRGRIIARCLLYRFFPKSHINDFTRIARARYCRKFRRYDSRRNGGGGEVPLYHPHLK